MKELNVIFILMAVFWCHGTISSDIVREEKDILRRFKRNHETDSNFLQGQPVTSKNKIKQNIKEVNRNVANAGRNIHKVKDTLIPKVNVANPINKIINMFPLGINSKPDENHVKIENDKPEIPNITPSVSLDKNQLQLGLHTNIPVPFMNHIPKDIQVNIPMFNGQPEKKFKIPEIDVVDIKPKPIYPERQNKTRNDNSDETEPDDREPSDEDDEPEHTSEDPEKEIADKELPRKNTKSLSNILGLTRKISNNNSTTSNSNNDDTEPKIPDNRGIYHKAHPKDPEDRNIRENNKPNWKVEYTYKRFRVLPYPFMPNHQILNPPYIPHYDYHPLPHYIPHYNLPYYGPNIYDYHMEDRTPNDIYYIPVRKYRIPHQHIHKPVLYITPNFPRYGP